MLVYRRFANKGVSELIFWFCTVETKSGVLWSNNNLSILMPVLGRGAVVVAATALSTYFVNPSGKDDEGKKSPNGEEQDGSKLKKTLRLINFRRKDSTEDGGLRNEKVAWPSWSMSRKEREALANERESVWGRLKRIGKRKLSQVTGEENLSLFQRICLDLYHSGLILFHLFVQLYGEGFWEVDKVKEVTKLSLSITGRRHSTGTTQHYLAATYEADGVMIPVRGTVQMNEHKNDIEGVRVASIIAEASASGNAAVDQLVEAGKSLYQELVSTSP